MHKKWNEFYKNNDRFYLLPHEDLSKFIDLLGEHDVLNILDLGCGTGCNLLPLAEAGFMVTGIDYAPSAAHLAEDWLREKGLEGKVYIADFKEDLIQFSKDEFDALVSINSIHYLEDPKELEDILGGINRVVKEGGLAMFVVPSNQTAIIQPSVTQVYFEKEFLESVVSAYFDILELYQDSHNSWVILARNKQAVS
ncbi:class I SAM-dependent methyltransferase [Candidatus Dojkabacteria bacterium]|uniref:Class I SAM-dependent methyltransferase n=1 Tax=Candidatus Dojkabacteria bacterium TaxID=2099670 RepID=A0A955L9H1_9BACT|nr:class I SAM-dependent methyltransferase [Candidatus Dojkabacteria bacterium]